jgi:lysophospholipase L1-like esterase
MRSNRLSLIAIGLLSIALLVSLALNYALYERGERYYSELNVVRLDPLGLSYYRDAAPPDSALPLVVFYGDSRAASWPKPSLDQFEFVNRGIDAQTSVQVLERFDYDIRPLRPKIIVIQVGINDLKTIPLFPEDRQVIVTNCEQNIQRLTEESADAGAIVILTTIFPVGEVPLERRLVWSDEVGVAIGDANDFIRSLVGDQVIILDAYSILVGDDGRTKPEYSQDLLHLTAAGYQRLNRELIPILETVN